MIYSVKVLGMHEHSKTIHLYQNVSAALLLIESVVEPQQITDLNELIRLQIVGIPALSVNGVIIIQKKVVSVSELTLLFQIIHDQKKGDWPSANLPR